MIPDILKQPFLTISLAKAVNNPFSPSVTNGLVHLRSPGENILIIAYSILTSAISGAAVGAVLGLSSRQIVGLCVAREITKIGLALGLDWVKGFTISPLRDPTVIMVGAIFLNHMQQNNNLINNIGLSASHHYLTILSLIIARFTISIFLKNDSQFNDEYSFQYSKLLHASEKGWFFRTIGW